jgi:hypothetical protein
MPGYLHLLQRSKVLEDLLLENLQLSTQDPNLVGYVQALLLRGAKEIVDLFLKLDDIPLELQVRWSCQNRPPDGDSRPGYGPGILMDAAGRGEGLFFGSP